MTIEPLIKQNLNASVRLALNKYIHNIASTQGSKLPSELDMAKSLNVSRATLRRTLDDLEQEGIIIRIHGKGTFVNPDALQIKLNLSPGYEFEKMINHSGFSSTVKVIRFETVRASREVSQKLNIPEGAPLYVVEKVYFANGHPAIISIDRFAHSIFPKDVTFTARECRESIFDTLRQKAGRLVMRDKIEIESMSIEQIKNYSAFHENMECSSCLVFHGINYDQNNIPIVFDTEFYDTNYINFSLIRRKHVFS